MRGAFSTILVHALLFIAAAVAAYLFISSLYRSLYDIQGAMIEREKIISSRLKTIIDIDSCTYDNTTNTLSLYVTNRGLTDLDPNKIKVFVDGVLVNISSISFVYVINNDNVWERYETIKIDLITDQGTKIIKVVTSSGAYDEKTLYITNTTCSIL